MDAEIWAISLSPAVYWNKKKKIRSWTTGISWGTNLWGLWNHLWLQEVVLEAAHLNPLSQWALLTCWLWAYTWLIPFPSVWGTGLDLEFLLPPQLERAGGAIAQLGFWIHLQAGRCAWERCAWRQEALCSTGAGSTFHAVNRAVPVTGWKYCLLLWWCFFFSPPLGCLDLLLSISYIFVWPMSSF